MSGTLPAVLFIAGRWVRSRRARAAGLLLAVAFAALTVVFVSVSAFTPTAAQQAQMQLGRFQQGSYASFFLGDFTPGTTARAAAALETSVPGSTVYLESNTLRPDSFEKFFFLGDTATVDYIEGPSIRAAYPGRYALEQGRWPIAAGEVTVSRHLLDALPDKSHFTMLSGRATFRIVGTMTDSNARHGDVIMAGPGTWEALTPRSTTKQYQPTEGQLEVRWSGPASVHQIADTLTSVLPPRPAVQGSWTEALEGNHSTRVDLEAQPVPTFGSDQPAVSYLPLLLIAVLSGALATASLRGTNRTDADRLLAIGVRRRVVTRAHTIGTAAIGIGSLVVGIAAGLLIAVLLRISVLAGLADQPLSPIPTPTLAVVLIALAPLLLITVVALTGSRTRSASLSRRLRLLSGMIRRLLVVLTAIAAVVLRGMNLTDVAAYLLMTAVLLLAPDLLRLLVAALPRRAPRPFVTRGLMRSGAARQGAAAVLIGACVAVPITVGTELASTQASDATYTTSVVPPGQLWIQRNGDTGDIRGLAASLRRVPGLGQPIPVRGLTGPTKRDGSAGSQARFDKESTGGLETMVVTDAADVRRVVGTSLPRTAESVLDSGGVIDFTRIAGPRRFIVYGDGGLRLSATAPLVTVKAHVSKPVRIAFSGAILLSTARQLGLPTAAPIKYIYPDVSTGTIKAAVAAAVAAGYDSEFLHYAVPPPPPVLPAAADVFFAGLVLAAFAVLLFVVTDQARRLRTYGSLFVAIGLRPRWARSLLSIQTALILAVGYITGGIAGAVAIQIAAPRYPVVIVPTTVIALACAASLCAAVAALGLAARGLTAAAAVD